MIHLIWSLFPLIYSLDHIDSQTQSLVYYKARLYVSHTLGQCIRYIIVMACADRFFVTRTSVRIRALNSMEMAVKLVLITCLACSLVAVHIPILLNIKSGVCGMFGLYKLIYSFYLITLNGIVPPVLMIIFSALTIYSIDQQHRNQVRARQRDRDFMRMIIAEVVVNIFTTIPYSANTVYGAVTYTISDKSTQRLEIESFISFLTQFLIYFISVTPFYVFILTSKPFRNEFINILIMCWKKYILRRTQVIPINTPNVTTTMNGRVCMINNTATV